MLEVTRLNGQKIVINCDLIEYIDANPDTTITLTTANKFVVKEGIEEVVDKIVKSRVITRSPFGGGKDRPVEPPVMKKVTVETYGVEYPEPTKM